MRGGMGRHHGIEGLVNLFAIETPGLTACLAIADHVVALLQNAAGDLGTRTDMPGPDNAATDSL